MQGIDRVRRVSELVRRQVSQFMLRELVDEGLGIVSVTAVDMSRDLQQATVYVSSFAEDTDIDNMLDVLEENVPGVRRPSHHVCYRVEPSESRHWPAFGFHQIDLRVAFFGRAAGNPAAFGIKNRGSNLAA